MIFNLSALILFFFKILKNPGGGTRYPTNQISLALADDLLLELFRMENFLTMLIEFQCVNKTN